jgi:peptide deformylase
MLKPKKKWIILDTQPVMRQKSSLLTFPLTKDDLTNIEKMQTYIDASYNGEDKKYHIRPGIGISACQIG